MMMWIMLVLVIVAVLLMKNKLLKLWVNVVERVKAWWNNTGGPNDWL